MDCMAVEVALIAAASPVAIAMYSNVRGVVLRHQRELFNERLTEMPRYEAHASVWERLMSSCAFRARSAAFVPLRLQAARVSAFAVPIPGRPKRTPQATASRQTRWTVRVQLRAFVPSTSAGSTLQVPLMKAATLVTAAR